MNDLDDFLKDTQRHLDRQLAESGATPDLAASVARAHAIDPASVPAQAVRETAELAPIAQLRPGARRSIPVPENMSDRAAIAPFTAALQGQLDADLARLIHRGAIASASGSALAPPAASTVAAPPAAGGVASPAASGVASPAASGVASPAASGVASPTASGVASPTASGVASPTASGVASPAASTFAALPAAGGVASPAASIVGPPSAAGGIAPPAASTVAAPSVASAIAAPIDLASRQRRTIVATAVALAAAVLITLSLGGAFEAQPGRPGAIPGAAALAGQPGEMARTHTVDRQAPGAARRAVPEDSADPPVPEDTQETAPAPDPRDSPSDARPRPKRTPKPATPGPASAPAEDPLAALDREAQTLWQQGRLRDAADKFAEIVQRAPGSRTAEAAYGDLFALENRLGGDAVSLWRAYLRQFPRGRYADDARAGVCRREPGAGRGACWSDYLVAHPDGAHRREAEQVTQAAGTP